MQSVLGSLSVTFSNAPAALSAFQSVFGLCVRCRLPLHVGLRVLTAGTQRRDVIDHEAPACAAPLAGGRAWVLAFELCDCLCGPPRTAHADSQSKPNRADCEARHDRDANGVQFQDDGQDFGITDKSSAEASRSPGKSINRELALAELSSAMLTYEINQTKSSYPPSNPP